MDTHSERIMNIWCRTADTLSDTDNRPIGALILHVDGAVDRCHMYCRHLQTSLEANQIAKAHINLEKNKLIFPQGFQ